MKSHKPVVYKREDHCVSRRQIDQDALRVLYRLQESGHIAYLVGGGVRDLLLGRNPKDFDIVTDAHPNRIRRLFRNAMLIGRRFRLAHIRFGENIIETSTFRCAPEADEQDDGELLQRRDNTFGTPEEDALRRDFTVNALFYNIADFAIIDYTGGMRDLERKMVRCIGDADARFKEDPVRMLRAIRFAARLGFAIERRTWRAMKRDAAEIAKAAPPRVLEEIYKLFAFRSGAESFRLLDRCGLRALMFPELHAFLRQRRTQERAFAALLKALDTSAPEDTSPRAELILAVLLWGRYQAEAAAQTHGQAMEHEQLSAMIDSLAGRLRVPKRIAWHVVHILEDQKRLTDTDGRRFSRSRLATRETFAATLDFYRVRCAAGEADPAILAEWERLLASGDIAAEEPSATKRRKRRPRRRGRSRKPSAKGNTGS